MKTSAPALVSLLLCLARCDAFTNPMASNGRVKSVHHSFTALPMSVNDNGTPIADLHRCSTFAVVVALGWSVFTSASLAATPTLPWSSNDTPDPSMISTNIMMAASDSNFADFSMPSYENALKSEVNSNLKGDNYLLGEASKNYASTTTTKSVSPTEDSKSKEDIKKAEGDKKAEKEAAKAAQKKAREAQMAAADAAANSQ